MDIQAEVLRLKRQNAANETKAQKYKLSDPELSEYYSAITRRTNQLIVLLCRRDIKRTLKHG